MVLWCPFPNLPTQGLPPLTSVLFLWALVFCGQKWLPWQRWPIISEGEGRSWEDTILHQRGLVKGQVLGQTDFFVAYQVFWLHRQMWCLRSRMVWVLSYLQFFVGIKFVPLPVHEGDIGYFVFVAGFCQVHVSKDFYLRIIDVAFFYQPFSSHIVNVAQSRLGQRIWDNLCGRMRTQWFRV